MIIEIERARNGFIVRFPLYDEEATDQPPIVATTFADLVSTLAEEFLYHEEEEQWHRICQREKESLEWRPS